MVCLVTEVHSEQGKRDLCNEEEPRNLTSQRWTSPPDGKDVLAILEPFGMGGCDRPLNRLLVVEIDRLIKYRQRPLMHLSRYPVEPGDRREIIVSRQDFRNDSDEIGR